VPRSRVDKFPETLARKLEEVIDVARSWRADAILHGGDIFDRPDLSPAVVSHFVRIMQGAGVPIYAVAGNHDIYGHNPATIPRTMIGLIDALDLIALLQPGESVMLRDGSTSIQLTGRHFRYDIDRSDPREAYCPEKRPDAAVSIHVVHGMLLAERPRFDTAYTPIERIAPFAADVTLAGHYHAGFGVVTREGKLFVNPGSLARIEGSEKEISRRPWVALLTIDGDDVRLDRHELRCAPPGEEVLSREALEEEMFRSHRLEEFVRSVRAAGDFEALDLSTLVDRIVDADGISREVRDEAVRRIGRAHERLARGEDARSGGDE